VGDPSLWAKISIHGDVYPRQFETVFPVAMLHSQLALSKDAPLDVHFDWRSFQDPDAHLLTLLDSAVDHCSHWDRLVLEGDVNIPSYLSALSRVKLRMPRLHRLEAYLDVNWFNPLGPDGLDLDFRLSRPEFARRLPRNTQGGF